MVGNAIFGLNILSLCMWIRWTGCWCRLMDRIAGQKQTVTSNGLCFTYSMTWHSPELVLLKGMARSGGNSLANLIGYFTPYNNPANTRTHAHTYTHRKLSWVLNLSESPICCSVHSWSFTVSLFYFNWDFQLSSYLHCINILRSAFILF